MAQLLQEEKEKFLVDVNETAKKRKALIVTEPETGFQNLRK